MGSTTTYGAYTDIKIIPLSQLKVGWSNGVDTDYLEFTTLENDSTFSVRGSMRPTDRGGARLQAIQVDVNAIVPQNAYQNMRALIYTMLTKRLTDVIATLKPQDGQSGGAHMEVRFDSGLYVKNWEVSSFEIASAGERPRMAVRVVGTLSPNALVGDTTGLLKQISGFS